MLTRPLLFIGLLTVTFPCAAQQLDSLLRVLDATPNDTSRVRLLRQAGQAARNSGQSAQAERYYEQSVRLAEHLGDRTGQARTLVYWGLIKQSTARLDTALILFEKAKKLFEQQRSTETTYYRLYNDIGYTYQLQGNYQTGLRYFMKGLKLAEGQRDPFLTSLLNTGLGMYFMRQQQPRRALPYLQQALRERLNGHQSLRDIAQAYNNLGSVYQDLKRYAPAMSHYQKALQLRQQANARPEQMSSYYNIGSLLIDMGRYAEARPALQQAVLLSGQQQQRRILSESYRQLSHLYRTTRQPDSALGYARRALAVAQEGRLAVVARDSYYELYLVEKQRGQANAALAWYERYEHLKDTLFTTETRRQLANMELTYAARQQETRIADLNRENQQRQQIVYLLSGGLLITAGLLGLVYRLYRSRRSAHRKIERQSQQLELMLRELHHRVKNNFQIVSSLLNLQLGRLKDPRARAAVRESQSRIEAMSLLHQRLYTTQQITQIDLKEYVMALLTNLSHLYGYAPPAIQLELRIDQSQLDVDTAIPLGLILNELITNSFKHAFPYAGQPRLLISFQPAPGTYRHRAERGYRLFVRDNGPGPDGPGLASSHLSEHPQPERSGPEPEASGWGADAPTRLTATRFGTQLIRSLSRQLGGTYRFYYAGGLCFELLLPAPGSAES